jgi:hypothetical protein
MMAGYRPSGGLGVAYGFQYIPRDDEPVRFGSRTRGGRLHVHRLDWRALAVSESIEALYRDIASVRLTAVELPATVGVLSRGVARAAD